jgi:anti-sigma regulatory factor (Ser/Thr protein kinase)
VRRCLLGREITADRRHDLDLLVSEVVTNAVVHAGTDIELLISADAESVVVEVRDFGAEDPVLRGTTNGADAGGWGLQFVETMSSEWGVNPAEPGKVVWFRVPTR